MKTVSLVEGLQYSVPQSEDRSRLHSISIEIASRLQELDELDDGDEDSPPAGIHLVQKLATIERRSTRAYRLVIDILSRQKSLSDSLESLGAAHPNKKFQPSSRQSWFQNARADAEIISKTFPEIGAAIFEILKRRSTGTETIIQSTDA